MTVAPQAPGAPRLTRDERERLVLDTAQRMFYARGVRSVGMDELVAEVGLGKASVYRLFPTKDALVAAYLTRLEEEILALIDADLEHHRDAPDRALLAVLDGVEDSVFWDGFRGCPFHNASIEYADADHPVRRVAARYREALRDRLRGPARRLVGEERGDRLAEGLAVLVDGIYANAAHLGADGPAAAGLALARQLVTEVATPRDE